MKKLLTIFTLLCVSVVGLHAAAVTGSSTENMAGQGNAFTNGYDYSFSTDGTSVTIAFTEKEDYTGLVAYLWNYTSGFAETGMSVSGHTASITLTGQTPGATLSFACKFAYAGGMSVTKQFSYTVENSGGSGGSDPEPARASECFGAKGHFGNPSAKHVYYQIDYADNKAVISLRSLTGYNLDFAEVHIAGVGNYAMTADGNGGYTHTINDPTVNSEWFLRFLYSDTNMGGNEMTSENVNSSDANIIYYKVGECTSSETENANIALASAGSSATASTGTASAAIDGNTGSRWESEHKVDPQWICVDFGARKKFNMVQLVHEGAYIKTYDIQISDDGTNFTTIKHVSETLAGFPYEQTIELGFDYVAQYLRIYGTERGESNYGYSLYELRAIYSTASVLTSISLVSAASTAIIGSAGVELTATPKDQKGDPMDETVSFEITPSDAGHMSGNKYVPDKIGNASIVAYNGSIRSSAVTVLGVPSENLSLSSNIATDNKIVAQIAEDPNGSANDAFFAVDDSDSEWQGSVVGTTDGDETSRTYDSWFVVDLGAFYDIDVITIKFEGACSELYHIDFSNDNSAWNTGYNYVGSYGINGHTDVITSFSNNTNVRYVRFWSTRAATQYGMKIHRFNVYGREHVEANTPVEAIELNYSSASVEIGQSITLAADVSPYYATDKTVTWASSDETVATVDDGVVTTLKVGTTNITATANDGSEVTATCALTVEAITAKTWWGTATITWDPTVDVLWSITRNANKTLTYTVIFGGDASGKVMQIMNGSWNALTGYTDADRTASYTTETTYETGTQIKPDHFFYFGGPRIELADAYTVGASNDRPTTSISSVVLNHSSSSLEMDETLQLSASVLPSYVVDRSVTWSSDNSSVATVSNTGLVTAKAAGTAHITATAADGVHTATCTINVVAELEPETYWNNGKDANFDVAVAYSITRNANRTLTFAIEPLHSKEGFVVQVCHADVYHNTEKDGDLYMYTTSEGYEDGATINGFFYMPFSEGAARVDFRYTVGSSSEQEAYIPIEFKDNATDASWINDNDGQTRDVEINRPMAADSKFKTLCLPFSMNAAQIAETFGECEILRLKEARMKSETDMYVGYERVSAIEAGYPYLITLLDESQNKLDFTAVTINSSTTYNTITVDAGNGKGVEMIGTFFSVQRNADTEFYLDASDNLLHSIGLYCSAYSVASLTIPAFRCYFRLVGFDDPAPVRARVMRMPEIATGIENTMDSNASTKQLIDGQLFIIRNGNRYTVTGIKVE